MHQGKEIIMYLKARISKLETKLIPLPDYPRIVVIFGDETIEGFYEKLKAENDGVLPFPEGAEPDFVIVSFV